MPKKASPVKSSGESGGSSRKSRKTLANEAEAQGAEDEWTVAETGAAGSRSASAATSSDDDAGSAKGAAGADDREAALGGRDDSAEVVDQPPAWLGSLLDRIDALEKSKPAASPAAGLAGSVAAGPPEDDDVIEDFTHRQQGFVQFPLNPCPRSEDPSVLPQQWQVLLQAAGSKHSKRDVNEVYLLYPTASYTFDVCSVLRHLADDPLSLTHLRGPKPLTAGGRQLDERIALASVRAALQKSTGEKYDEDDKEKLDRTKLATFLSGNRGGIKSGAAGSASRGAASSARAKPFPAASKPSKAAPSTAK